MALREQWFLLNEQGIQTNPQPRLIASSIGLTNQDTINIKTYSDLSKYLIFSKASNP